MIIECTDCKDLLVKEEKAEGEMIALTHQLTTTKAQLEEMGSWKTKFEELQQSIKNRQCRCDEPLEEFTEEDFRDIFPVEIQPDIQEVIKAMINEEVKRLIVH